MRLSFLCVATIALSPSAHAQITCATLDTDWIDAEKTIAMERLGYLSDNSAPRETNRLLRISHVISAQSANLAMRQQLKCQLPPTPVGDSHRFTRQAADCGIERIGSTAREIPPKCKTAEWQPEAK